MEVGDLITLYRKQAGMTIDDLAKRSGVPKGTLNKIIGGVTKAPTLPNMKAIAKALGKTLEDFDDLPIKREEQPAEDGELSKEAERMIKLLRSVPENQKELAVDLVESTLLAVIRHAPIPAETQAAVPAGSSR